MMAEEESLNVNTVSTTVGMLNCFCKFGQKVHSAIRIIHLVLLIGEVTIETAEIVAISSHGTPPSNNRVKLLWDLWIFAVSFNWLILIFEGYWVVYSFMTRFAQDKDQSLVAERKLTILDFSHHLLVVVTEITITALIVVNAGVSGAVPLGDIRTTNKQVAASAEIVYCTIQVMKHCLGAFVIAEFLSTQMTPGLGTARNSVIALFTSAGLAAAWVKTELVFGYYLNGIYTTNNNCFNATSTATLNATVIYQPFDDRNIELAVPSIVNSSETLCADDMINSLDGQAMLGQLFLPATMIYLTGQFMYAGISVGFCYGRGYLY